MAGFGKPSVMMVVTVFSLCLAGCGSSDDEQGVGGVTSGEARALNEAAAVLDKRGEDARSALNATEAEQNFRR